MSEQPSDPFLPGPVLPETTSDEQDHGWGERAENDDDDRFLREVPPHHGD